MKQNRTVMVSVIMPSLNVREYIEESILSVLNQTLQEIEVICIDAGSTDGTLEILKKYAAKDDRIILLHSEVRSYGKQANMGIGTASGKYIAIVDTDDYIHPGMYQTLVEIAESEQLDFVKSDYYMFRTMKDESRVFLPAHLFSTEKESFYNKVLVNDEAAFLHDKDVYIWRGIYRLDFIKNNDIYFQETRGAAWQDTGFHHLVLLYAKRRMYIKDMFYYYRRDNTAASVAGPDGTMFLFWEYSALLSCISIEKFPDRTMKYIYIRICRGFLLAFQKTVYYANDITKYEDSLRWFCRHIKEWIAGEMIVSDDFAGEVWDALCLLTTDIEKYICKCKKKALDIHDAKKELRIYTENHEVIIFGCGRWGQRIMMALFDCSCNIIGFCDNDKEKIGKLICDRKIYEPCELIKKYPDALILIAIKDQGMKDKIKGQVEMLGVCTERIFLINEDMLVDYI